MTKEITLEKVKEAVNQAIEEVESTDAPEQRVVLTLKATSDEETDVVVSFDPPLINSQELYSKLSNKEKLLHHQSANMAEAIAKVICDKEQLR